jgi:hypothetical protein
MENIWESFNFKERQGKSVYDYLKEQESSFIAKTKGVLILNIDSRNVTDFSHMMYDVYVVSKILGNYRKRILTIMEGDMINSFPVTIMAEHLTDKTLTVVNEKEFLSKLEEMLLVPTIKKTIENLYAQSAEHLKEMKKNDKTRSK